MGKHILIVGAGAMGLITGYHLNLGGSKVTFLVRPHRAESLRQPQAFYNYGDHRLKTFSDYDFETSPEDAFSKNVYDYILVTLDGAGLLSETGQALTKKIGEAVKTSNTAVLLGTMFPNIKTWFTEHSGLPQERVSLAFLMIHVYSTKSVTLPLHAPTDASLLAKAQWAYKDCLGPGIIVEESTTTQGFAEAYNNSGASFCAVVPFAKINGSLDIFPLEFALHLLGWPKLGELDAKNPLWQLGVKAKNEIGGILSNGPEAETPAEEVLAMFAGVEKTMLPLDFQEFGRYHHGDKVITQNRRVLEAFLEEGKKQGKEAPALKSLLEKVDEKKA